MRLGLFQEGAYARLGLSTDPQGEIADHAGSLFQQIVELSRLTKADAVGCVWGVKQRRETGVAEEEVIDHPFAVYQQAVEGVGATDLGAGIAHAGNAAFQPVAIDPGDMPLQAAFQGGVLHLPLGNAQGGIAPQGIVGTAGVEQPAFDFVDVVLANPGAGDRAGDLFSGQRAQVNTGRAFEASGARKFLVKKAYAVGVAIAVQLGVGQGGRGP